MKRPPDVVRRVMETVHLVLTQSESQEIPWNDVVKTVCRPDIVKNMKSVNLKQLGGNHVLLRRLYREYLCKSGSDPLRHERVRRGSKATVACFGWLILVMS